MIIISLIKNLRSMKENLQSISNQQSVEVVNGGNSQVITRKASKKKEPFHAVREKEVLTQ